MTLRFPFLAKARLRYTTFSNNIRKANLSSLGRQFGVPIALQNAIEKCKCQLYKIDTDDVNEARYAGYCSPSRVKQQNLPPTKDELKLHIQRDGYQAARWRRALDNLINAPSATGHGWCLNNGTLGIKWITQDLAPSDVLKDVFCPCNKDCCTNRCCCRKAGLKCTDVCQCGKNQFVSTKNQPPAVVKWTRMATNALMTVTEVIGDRKVKLLFDYCSNNNYILLSLMTTP